MNEKTNLGKDILDSSEEYFRDKDETYETETEEYFPQESSKPPHY